jgi:hypothetical protein
MSFLMKKQITMDGDSRNLEKNSNRQSSDSVHDDRSVLQSVRVRRCPILANRADWDIMESELRLVLYSGIFLWALHLLSLAL